MPKYIDIEDILFPRPIPAKQTGYDFGYARGWNAALAFALIVPAADVQPVVRAQWIDIGPDSKCSACDFACNDVYYLGSAKFYPNCGAKMEVPP